MGGISEEDVAELEKQWKGEPRDTTGENEGEDCTYDDEDPEELSFD